MKPSSCTPRERCMKCGEQFPEDCICADRAERLERLGQPPLPPKAADNRSPSRSCSLPEWLKPGVWVRNKLSPHQPRAFVMFVDTEHCKGGFQYHFEKPFKWHVRDEGWQTGGTVFPIGVEHWELAPSETARIESTEDTDARTALAEADLKQSVQTVQKWLAECDDKTKAPPTRAIAVVTLFAQRNA